MDGGAESGLRPRLGLQQSVGVISGDGKAGRGGGQGGEGVAGSLWPLTCTGRADGRLQAWPSSGEEPRMGRQLQAVFMDRRDGATQGGCVDGQRKEKLPGTTPRALRSFESGEEELAEGLR